MNVNKKGVIGAVSCFVVLMLAALLSSAGIAMGQAQLPPQASHHFFGEVRIAGAPAPEGVIISAEIDGVEYERGVTDAQGRYGYPDDVFKVPYDDQATPEKDGGADGDEILFKVNGVVADTDPPGPILFESGGTSEVNLSLVAPVDTTPPTVMRTSPASGATGEAITVLVTATFSEAMNPAAITAASFTLTTDGTAVPGTVSYNAGTATATFDPGADLAYNTAYTATIATTVTDLAGNNLEEDYSWSFTTTAQTAGGGGGGGAPSDTTPPVISDVSASDVTDSNATITWITNEPSTSQVEYWPGSLSPLDSTLVTSHSVTLTDLTPETTYNYNIMSSDAKGNLAKSDVYTFTTKAAPAPQFAVADLVISPEGMSSGEVVSISVVVANTGGASGSHTVSLRIDGELEASTDVLLDPGASDTVTFTVNRDKAGTYGVTVDGLSGSFTVTEEEEGFAWWALGLGLGVLLLALITYFGWRWRRA